RVRSGSLPSIHTPASKTDCMKGSFEGPGLRNRLAAAAAGLGAPLAAAGEAGFGRSGGFGALARRSRYAHSCGFVCLSDETESRTLNISCAYCADFFAASSGLLPGSLRI